MEKWEFYPQTKADSLFVEGYYILSEKTYGTESPSFNSFIARAEIALFNGDDNSAIIYLNKALNQKPDSFVKYRYLSLLLANEKYDSALNYLRNIPDSKRDTIETFVYGLLNIRQNPALAASIFEYLVPPEKHPLLSYWLAKSYLRSGAIKTTEKLYKSVNDKRVKQEMKRMLSKHYLDNDKPDNAKEFLPDLLSKSDQITLQRYYKIIGTSQEKKKINEVLVSNCKDIQSLLSVIEEDNLTEKQKIKIGKIACENKKTADYGRKIIQQFNSETDKDYYIGKSYYIENNFSKSLEFLKIFYEKSNDKKLLAEALYMLSKASYRTGKIKDYVSYSLKLADNYPESSYASSSLFRLCKMSLEENNLRDLRKYSELFLRRFPDSKEAQQVWSYYVSQIFLENDYQGLKKFLNSDISMKINQSGSFFWLGKLAMTEKSEYREFFRKAIDIAPYSYYGYRSYEILNGKEIKTTLRGIKLEERNELLGYKNLHEDKRLEYRFLYWVYLACPPDEAQVFSNILLYCDNANKKSVYFSQAEAYHIRRKYRLASRSAYEFRNFLKKEDNIYRRIIYPCQFSIEIDNQSKASSLNPLLVFAIIRQESLFDAKAKSSAGALGLMQLLPSTAEYIAKRINLQKFSSNTDLYKPEINLKLGCIYLSGKLKQHNGRLEQCLAGYNAGSSRVKRWEKDIQPYDEDVFSERIPFPETYNYVRGIYRGIMVYNYLWGSGQN
ncbi:MAG: transglycosylase SLT domain-containing protein [Candidatus Coatesbacteria bacterium]|nr:transglycosylase SLT domain-containing protein [Candidatus Coatesbacteria bacterium]